MYGPPGTGKTLFAKVSSYRTTPVLTKQGLSRQKYLMVFECFFVVVVFEGVYSNVQTTGDGTR